MDAYECIATKLDVREFATKRVPADIKLKILEAARLTGSGNNSQHWRFILVDDPDGIKKLAQDASTGRWIGGVDFAVVVLTDPARAIHMLDAGRVLQDMQLAAWNFGVASRPYTGMLEEEMRRDFGVPANLKPSVVVGFGYPKGEIKGRKSRRPLEELVYVGKFGTPLDPKAL